LNMHIIFKSVLMLFTKPKKYQNWSMLVETAACRSWRVFSRHGVYVRLVDANCFTLPQLLPEHRIRTFRPGHNPPDIFPGHFPPGQLPVFFLHSVGLIWLAVWLSGNALASINAVALSKTRLVPGWVTVRGRVNHLGM